MTDDTSSHHCYTSICYVASNKPTCGQHRELISKIAISYLSVMPSFYIWLSAAPYHCSWSTCSKSSKKLFGQVRYSGMLLYFLLLSFVAYLASGAPLQACHQLRSYNGCNSRKRASAQLIASVLPGDPLLTGTLSQGAITTVGLYSNVIFARLALSFFPNVVKQFPILKPIITGTIELAEAFDDFSLILSWPYWRNHQLVTINWCAYVFQWPSHTWKFSGRGYPLYRASIYLRYQRYSY